MNRERRRGQRDECLNTTIIVVGMLLFGFGLLGIIAWIYSVKGSVPSELTMILSSIPVGLFALARATGASQVNNTTNSLPVVPDSSNVDIQTGGNSSPENSPVESPPESEPLSGREL